MSLDKWQRKKAHLMKNSLILQDTFSHLLSKQKNYSITAVWLVLNNPLRWNPILLILYTLNNKRYLIDIRNISVYFKEIFILITKQKPRWLSISRTSRGPRKEKVRDIESFTYWPLFVVVVVAVFIFLFFIFLFFWEERELINLNLLEIEVTVCCLRFFTLGHLRTFSWLRSLFLSYAGYWKETHFG